MDITPEQNPFITKYGRYILYPAVNWPHKNHYRLIEAFRLVCQCYGIDDVRLVLTGASCVEPREHSYRHLLNQQWADDRVLELGFVSSTQLYPLMRGAELLVFPSMYEGFGIPVLEALRLGTPVLAADLPVMQEWFGGHFQPLVDVRNSLTIADNLYTLLTDNKRQIALRNAGRTHSDKFTSRRMAEETLEFLSTIVDDVHRSKHTRSHRDMVILRSKNYHLLFHLMLDSLRSELIEEVTAAVSILRDKLTAINVGFVFYIPISIFGSAKTENGVDCIDSELHKATRNRRHEVVVPIKEFVDTICRKISKLLLTCPSEVTYFEGNEPSRAIRFYISNQVTTRFHSFVQVARLATLANDERFVQRCLTVAHRENDKSDGFYVGPSTWPVVRDSVIQVLHDAPWSLSETGGSDCIPAAHEFVLTDAFVQRRELDFFSDELPFQLASNGQVSYPRARFVYIETELTQPVGHHFALVSGLCQVAKASGLEPIVGANLDASFDGVGEDIQFDPFFPSYSQAPVEHVTPSRFAEELLVFLGRHSIGAGDYVYLHMPIPTLIIGVLQIVATSLLEDLPLFLIRICSTDDSFRWHEIRLTSCIRSIGGLGVARRNRIRVFVESLPLRHHFENATGVSLPVLLNPVVRELALARLAVEKLWRQSKGSSITFGYFGEARQEKGFHLLPKIIEGLVRRYGPHRVRFLVQTSATRQNDTDQTRAARHELQLLAETHKAGGTIMLLDNSPDMSSYYRALAKCDAVLMPYDPSAYSVRGSGVALEGLVLGLPIVVSQSTDMAITFRGPWCVTASTYSPEAFERACSNLVENYTQIATATREFIRVSPLVRTEAQYLRVLLCQDELPDAVGTPEEKPVALWIGNDVLSQGCSAVYDAQRGFLERRGFEVYNVYVPFPDIDGNLQSDDTLEKHLVANSLGWRRRGYHFGCYSWILNQSDGEGGRRNVLQDIRQMDGSTSRLLCLNHYNTFPTGLLRLVESRKIALVCVNYVHLLPVVEALGLLRRSGTRVVLESHDIQAHQYAVRAGRPVDEEDKELELAKLSDADAVLAISMAEYSEIREANPWLNIKFVLPTIKVQQMAWTPGASELTSNWLDIWCQSDNLQLLFDLRTPDSLFGFRVWILAFGRLEWPDCPLSAGLISTATLPHPNFPAGSGGITVPLLIGHAWESREDLRSMWPNAGEPDHADRAALLRWAVKRGWEELGLAQNGSSPSIDVTSTIEQSPSLVEAFVLARPVTFADPEYRAGLWRWLANARRINVIVVGSEHPANLISIRYFVNEVFRRFLEPQNVNLILVGRCGAALGLTETGPQLFIVGEVDAIDPLYQVASVVAVPTVVGSGTPIKVLDAFARGLCVSASSFVDQSLGLSAFGFPLNNSASAFAADILGLLKSSDARQKRAGLAKQFAATRLSTDVYDASWEELAGLASASHADAQVRTVPTPEDEAPQATILARPKRGRRNHQEAVNAD